MFRLFDRLIGNETKITTKLHYHADITSVNSFGGFYGNSEFKPCCSAQEFSDVYELIKREIEMMQSSAGTDFTIEIKLSGKLNGNDIAEEFKDLESYHQFLENNWLIKPSIKLVH
jgi:hypothetical protein